MMTGAALQAIRCTGRPVDDAGRPTGPACGRLLHQVKGGYCLGCGGEREELHVAATIAAARADGWLLGPVQPDGTRPAACPRCAKPDPAVVKMCKQLAR